MDSDESTFLQKIQDTSRNSHECLSEREIQRAKVILNDAQCGVRILDEDARAHLRIALAPHRRLPTEILAQIFVESAEDYFPHDLSVSPWALRSVCSRWRTISLNDIRLWRRLTISNTYNAYSNECRLSFPLSFILDHLIPSEGPFSISLSAHNAWKTMEAMIIPNLPRMIELSLSIDDIFDLLHLITNPEFRIPEVVALEFRILPGFPVLPSGLSATGNVIAERGLMTAQKLRKLELSCAGFEEICRALLLLDFPWAQLVELDINNFNTNVLYTLNVLNQCQNLEKLSLSFTQRHSQPQPSQGVVQLALRPMTLPHLTFMELTDAEDHVLSFFIVPALIELVVDSKYLPVNEVIGLITKSRCKISIFRHPRPATYLFFARQLIEVLPHVKVLICTPGLMQPEDLRDIGSGILLPYVKVLHCTARSPHAFLKMVEALVSLARSEENKIGGKLRKAETQNWEESQEYGAIFERLGEINRENGTLFTMRQVR
ncbi:hypothetical protein H0H81_008790 [Sphagnurus paluster]|uniref:F-box domain-containing protein n=1 Tax=Sphagnurus paluster TaxID=117069 RepID=A0A9P7FWQ0_9AGAR|nr:hypothetical protein H0H81_008790 [Sphagnurus paluster]